MTNTFCFPRHWEGKRGGYDVDDKKPEEFFSGFLISCGFACFSQLLTADSHIRRMPLDLAIQRERVRNQGLG